MALYAFDGTWNRQHDQAEYSKNSNVVKFAKAYRAAKAVYQKDGDRVHVAEDDDNGYIDGIGTRHGRLGRIFGGALGAGGKQRIKEALARVDRKTKEGDGEIDVIGFSRGAALALHFVNELESRKIPVRFLGVWDVVAAFGIPIDLGPLSFQRINLGYKLKLPKNVQRAFHAMALDERRESFRVTRVKDAYEVWFRGVHSDIGGGNQNEGLSNIALAWMLRKAAAVGVPVNLGVIDQLQLDPEAEVKPSKRDPRLDPFRKCIPQEWFHYTIRVRKNDHCQNPPDGCLIENEEFERTRISLA